MSISSAKTSEKVHRHKLSASIKEASFFAYMDMGKNALEEDSDEEDCKEVREESKSANLRRGEVKVEKVLHLTVQEFRFKKVWDYILEILNLVKYY